MIERRSEIALQELLETVAYEGEARVAKWRLAKWFGQEKYSRNIRRDLRRRWHELQMEEYGVENPPPLKIAELAGVIILMNAANFSPDDE